MSQLGWIVIVAVLAPATAGATITRFGSPLSVPATLNTSENLGYYGTYTPVPPSSEAPNALFHTPHWGADTALWNVALASGNPTVPATGQALKVSLEGCAKPAAGGPQPLTQIHFQDLSPLPGGGARVKLSSQGYDMPVCGQNGAGGSTITTYEPVNLCVAQGDYVAFNDEGGYVPFIYRAGVPYQVMGVVSGSSTNSFIRGNGVGNGATMSARDTTANDGFASNPNEELMLQVTLGTGPDATHICPGGTAGLPGPIPPVKLRAQTDGINHRGIVAVALYCTLGTDCKGLAKLTLAGRRTSYGRTAFSVRAGTTSHVPIRLSRQLLALVHRGHALSALLTTVVGGKTATQMIAVTIF